jgi:peptide/nickel transport system substrate-binding protein
VIDKPGPWGTGPFELVEGHSSISTRCGIQKADPFTCAWLIEAEDRSERLVLEANMRHWNAERVPRVKRVIFRNDLSPADALDLCVSGNGEVDIVTEVSPADARKVLDSEHADLVPFDANRVLVGIFNRWTQDVPLDDRRVREALNLAVDRDRLIEEGLGGYANALPALTPAWCAGFPKGQEPRPHDPAGALRLLDEAGGWPDARRLRLASPESFAGLARLLASDLELALGLEVDVIVVPTDGLLAGAKMLVEKKLTPPWDVLLHAWFDLSSEAPPAAVHREFFGSDGAFRAGPELPEFDGLFAEMVAQVDPEKLVAVAERIDAHCYEESLALFLCAPQSLTAVNRHVTFVGYRTTFELAEADVDDGHWSLSGERAPVEAAG